MAIFKFFENIKIKSYFLKLLTKTLIYLKYELSIVNTYSYESYIKKKNTI